MGMLRLAGALAHGVYMLPGDRLMRDGSLPFPRA
jgi:hypothetical protein